MAYDKKFYEAYIAYLAEPTVRAAHDFIFEIVRNGSSGKDFRKVVDLGCGEFNEFFKYTTPHEYVGIDLNANKALHRGFWMLKADYRTLGNIRALIAPNEPSAFVSLFSSEITAPHNDNYLLYEKIFRKLPSVNAGLVSGFYYASKKNVNPIVETGGVVSYQTLEDIEDVKSNIFSEKRIILPVPSKMFGQDVFEVWKIFVRHKNL